MTVGVLNNEDWSDDGTSTVESGLSRRPDGCTPRETFMKDRITLVVRFRIIAFAREEFLAKLEEISSHIVKEDTFVEASLVQDMRDPESILNYEVWNESPESFMKEQLSKAYRADFEKMIVELKIERTPAWYSTIANWTKA